MKAFVLAAGLGTRLKPWTLSHPKALAPVGGVPMLERVIRRLEGVGFDYIVVNIHHFGEQIIEFLVSHEWKAKMEISDEREKLLDTGGALTHAMPLLAKDSEPFLIHNVDILSNAPLDDLMCKHKECGADATLLVSNRDSSRRLLFDETMHLRGWKNTNSGELRGKIGEWPVNAAFSGIHVMNVGFVEKMIEAEMPDKFPVMDFYLTHTQTSDIKGLMQTDLHLIDIGKPETLARANNLFL